MTNRTPPEQPTEPGPSEADVVHLLGIYADALDEQHVVQEQDAQAPDPHKSIVEQRWSQATVRPEGKVTMDPSDFDQEPVDVSVTPAAEKQTGRGRLLVGALAFAGAAVVGGFLLTNDDATELNVAEAVEEEAVEEESVEEEAMEEGTGAEDGAADTTDAQVASTTTTVVSHSVSDVAEASAFGHGPGQIIFADGEFVSIGQGPDGITVSRSANGTDWSTTAVNGFPENANAHMLARTDSGWATIIEVYPEFDEADDTDAFEVDFDPQRWLATSPDLADWTTTELPDLEADALESVWISGIAGVGDRVGIVMQVQPDGPDEFRVLLEAGILDESDLENYCGTDFEEDGPIVGYTCSFDDAMMLEEPGREDDDTSTPATTIPPDAFEEQREELFRLVPGDPVYDVVADIYTADGDEGLVPAIVVSGPLNGPFDISTLPVSGYQASIVSTDEGFVVIASDGRGGTVLTSPDGVTWTSSGEVELTDGFSSITASGNRLLALSNSSDPTGNSVEAWVSDDFGATWTTTTINTQLFGAYGQPVGGPAGFAVMLDGSVEPFEDPFGQLEPLDIPKDGFTMVLDMIGGTASLIGPDGETIHDSVSLDEIFGNGTENVARTEGELDETIVWLDPETGVDLVAVNETDFEAAFEASTGVSVDAVDPGGVDQDRAAELWFSEDGQTWTLLEQLESNQGNGYTTLSAVGDDEVIVRSETFNEPPAELLAFEREGREPTDEEIEAIDSFFADQQEDSVIWRSIPAG